MVQRIIERNVMTQNVICYPNIILSITVNYKMKCVTMEPPLTEPNVQKHNQRLESTSTPKDRTKSRRKYIQLLMELFDIWEYY